MGTEEVERNEDTEVDPRVGTVLQNRYRILERLAEGGMGVVYRAERLLIERTVAIKFLHAGFAANPDSRKRFERELKAMSRLNHPNCISVIDFGFDEGPYFVMDYITGRTLKDELAGGRLLPGRAIYITTQILGALTHAHGQAMVHRDIKPANVILTDAEGAPDHVYVLDFGLAKFVSSSRDDLTASWMVLGTPAYMSPEQSRGDTVDVPSDVYSTGALLFELLTGEKLYSSDNPIETLQKHQSAPIPALRDRVPDGAFSEELELVVRKSLAKDPSQRFRTAGEFVEALEVVPEAGYSPRASSQIRAQTASLLAEAAAQRAASVDMLSLADAIDLKDDSGAGKRAAGTPAAETDVLLKTLPPQASDPGQPGADAQLDAPAGKGAGKDAGNGAAKAKGSKGKSTKGSKDKDTKDKDTKAKAAKTRMAKGTKSKVAKDSGTSAPDAKAAGDKVAADKAAGDKVAADRVADAKLASAKVAGDKVAAEQAGRDAGAASSRPSGARIMLALMLPIVFGAGAWYLLFNENGAEADQSATAAARAVQNDTPDPGPGDEVAPDTPEQPEANPVETIKDVEELIAQDKREEAIQGILKLRRTKFPNSAYLAYLLGNLYFEKVYWGDGLDAYNDALQLERSYRTKAKINENAIRALSHDEARVKANNLFLKHIGRSGLPYLRKAAKADKNPVVRRRASWLIRQITKRR